MRYDPTINLGHVLTFVGMLTAGTLAWSEVRSDQRLDRQAVVVQKEKIEANTARIAKVEGNVSLIADENRKSIDELRREVARGFERVNDKLEKIREDKRK